jgi:Leucine-rich repeat (LRR) protein
LRLTEFQIYFHLSTEPQVIPIYCENYHEFFNENRYVDTSNIAKPQACEFKSAITDPNTVLTVDSSVSNEDIIALDLTENELLEYLPLEMAINFPNINLIRAEECSIKELSKASMEGLTNLKFLDLDDNFITTLLTDTLSSLVNLERIDLGELS